MALVTRVLGRKNRAAARSGAKAVIAGLDLSNLQQAVPEIEPARAVVWRHDQTATIKGGRRRRLAERLMRLGKAEQRVGGIGRDLNGASKRRFGLTIRSVAQLHYAELNRELRHHRRDLKTAAQRRSRFIVLF